MSTCEFDDRLDLLLDGLLTPSEERATRAHLKTCPACARRERELRALRDGLSALDGPVPEDLHARIMAAVAAEPGWGEAPKKKKQPLIFRPAFRRALSGVAACAVLVLGAFAWRTLGAKSAAPQAPEATGDMALPAAEPNGISSGESYYMTMEPMAPGAAPTTDAATCAPEEPRAAEPDGLAKDAPSETLEGFSNNSGGNSVLTFAAAYAYAGELEALRPELEGFAYLSFAEEEGRWTLIFETGTEGEAAFLSRLTERGFTPADLPGDLADSDGASPYTLYILTQN